MVPQLIGFGFTVGWLWLFFLDSPLFITVMKQWPGSSEYYFFTFLFCTSVAYLGIGKWVRDASLLAKRKFLVFCVTLMSICPGLIILLPRANPSLTLHFPWMSYLLIAGGGIGGSVLLLAWLETFLSFSAKTFGLLYTGGVIIATGLLFAGTGFSDTVGIILTLTTPWVALIYILRFSPADRSYRPETTYVKKMPQSFPPKLILLIVLFYIAGGFMFKLAGCKYTFTNFFWIANLSYLAVVILAGLTLYYSPDLDLRLLSRPVLPFLTAGFILLPFITGYEVISFLLLQAGFALFDMYTWLLFVYIAGRQGRPVEVLGLGMFFSIFAMFGGNLVFTIMAKILPSERLVDSLSIIAGLITLLTSLIFQDDKETFTGWVTYGQDVSVIPTNSSKLHADPSNFNQTTHHPYLIDKLTPREAEILALLLSGRNNPYIREKLNISPNTLKYHLRNLYQKFTVNNRQELISLLAEDSNDDLDEVARQKAEGRKY